MKKRLKEGWKLLKFLWHGYLYMSPWISLMLASVFLLAGLVVCYLTKGNPVMLTIWILCYGAAVTFYFFVAYKSRKWHRKENSKQVMTRLRGKAKHTPDYCKLLECKYNFIAPPKNSQECISCDERK